MGEAAVTSGEMRKASQVPAWLVEKLKAKYRLTSSGRAAPLIHTFWAVMSDPFPMPITSCPAASRPGSADGAEKEVSAEPSTTTSASRRAERSVYFGGGGGVVRVVGMGMGWTWVSQAFG